MGLASMCHTRHARHSPLRAHTRAACQRRISHGVRPRLVLDPHGPQTAPADDDDTTTDAGSRHAQFCPTG
eukprot:2744825-Pleurochrysis_carterae.AAC.1